MRTEMPLAPYPGGLLPMSNADRCARFGRFDFSPDPTPTNPEHIHIDFHWAQQNIIMVRVPQLLMDGKPRLVSVNHLVAPKLLEVFTAWEEAGLLEHIVTFDGCWVPRFKRQSGTIDQRRTTCQTLGVASLSNHAWGSAFDINARWNALGTPGAPAGTVGSTVELRDIARQHGWFCGADFRSRSDAMHLEVAAGAV
jgi:hypothetical protein